MNASFDAILAQALALPESDRVALATRLFNSVDDNVEELPPEQFELEWAADILRRQAEMDQRGKIGKQVEDVIRDLREKYS